MVQFNMAMQKASQSQMPEIGQTLNKLICYNMVEL